MAKLPVSSSRRFKVHMRNDFPGFVLLAVLCALLPQVSHGQAASAQTNTKQPVLFGTNTNLEGSSTDKGATLGATASPETPTSASAKRRGEFAFAPIPMVNPSIGNGGGAAVMYARRMGAGNSPPSAFGAGGFGTGNGSWGGGHFNCNFFGVGSDAGQAGISIPLSQHSRAFLVEPKIRLWPHIYLGPRYHIICNRIGLNSTKFDPADLPIPLPSDLKFTTAALGIRAQRDTSNSAFYPTSGSLIDLVTDFFGPALGGDRTYQNMTLSSDDYLGLGAKNVFAIHGSLCAASDKAPFFDVCELGQSKDLRGYQVGQFRDNRMLAGQMEYRRELFWRLGAVAFAGAGAVGKTFGDMGNAEPGGGLGLRFMLAKQNHINLRADYAWGDSSHATYVSLGEAF